MSERMMPEAEDRDLAYRRALGCFATGVTVITARGPQGPVGLTVNSFTSVSLRPRLVLWCLDEGSERGAAFLAAERFVVNVLGAEQQAQSMRFAEPGGGLLRLEECEQDATGAPLLRGALARFVCRLAECKPLGDHFVLVGEVERFEQRGGPALTYFRGRYGEASLSAGPTAG